MSAVLLFTSVFFIIMFSDLECVSSVPWWSWSRGPGCLNREFTAGRGVGTADASNLDTAMRHEADHVRVPRHALPLAVPVPSHLQDYLNPIDLCNKLNQVRHGLLWRLQRRMLARTVII